MSRLTVPPGFDRTFPQALTSSTSNGVGKTLTSNTVGQDIQQRFVIPELLPGEDTLLETIAYGLRNDKH